MKRNITLILFAFITLQASAQSGLNNLGFENWSENNPFGNPQPNGLGSIGQTENTTDPIEGGSALSLTTKRFQTGATTYDTAGVSLLGDITLSGVQLGAAYSKCPDSLTGYVRYNLPNQDTGVIAARVWKGADTTIADSLLGGTLSNWTHFNIPFKPSNCGGVTPDSIVLIFSSEAVLPEAGLDIGTQTPGSGSFELDGVQVWSGGTPSAISDLTKGQKEAISVHPNPAQERVRFELPTMADRIRIYDMTGRSVRSVELDQSSSRTIDVSDMDEGLYIYRVERNGQALHSDKLQIVR